MITIGSASIPWREGITVEALVRETGDALGVSFVSVEESGAGCVRRRFIRRMDWPTAAVADGAKIRLVVAASGG